MLAVATLLQAFHFTKNNPSYQLQIKTTVTIKPQYFFMNARVRDPDFLDKAGIGISATTSEKKTSKPQTIASNGGLPLLIAYGSNTGTCEALANELASSAPEHGFSPEVKGLDSVTAAIPRETPTIIITASYEGQPLDNAAHFVEWLKSADPSELKDAKFSVFGVGNSKHAQPNHLPKSYYIG